MVKRNGSVNLVNLVYSSSQHRCSLRLIGSSSEVYLFELPCYWPSASIGQNCSLIETTIESVSKLL